MNILVGFTAMSMTKTDKIAKEYQREMLKSAFASLFWSVISKKKQDGGSLKGLADKLSINKSAVSRWFSGKSPNWELNTIADIADALELDIRIAAVDRATGQMFTCSGEVVKIHAAISTRSNVVTMDSGLRVWSSTTGNPVELRGTKVGA